MTEIIENMKNEDYHSDKRISSSLLKTALLSPAHIKAFLEGKKKKSDAMILGTAIHCYYLERERFESEYTIEFETYKRKTGDFNVGDYKLDEFGEKKVCISSPDGEMTGETAKKFLAMKDALDNCEKAKELLVNGKTEMSLFTDKERVRLDLLTSDGWIVDVKTVSGTSEMPLEPEEFAREFWRFGYDLQMYMYCKVARECGLDIKGFLFLCVDAKIPAGVRIFYFKPEDEWFDYGKQRYETALKRLSAYDKNNAVKYEQVIFESLPVPFKAIGELSK